MSSGSGTTSIARWVIVGCSFLVLFVSQGMTLGGLQVFDEKLLAHLAEVSGEPVSLGAFKGGLAITNRFNSKSVSFKQAPEQNDHAGFVVSDEYERR